MLRVARNCPCCTLARIYLVDDHTIVRDGLRGVLVAAGHEVVGEAADAEQALAQLPLVAPDLLLLDLQLGGRSGLTLLAELQARAQAPRTIVLTMSASAVDIAASRALGASGYMLKDVSRDLLLAGIDTVLLGGALQPPHAAPGAAAPLAAQLSARELQIMLMVVQGGSSQAIGDRLGLSPKTVDTYRSRLMTKLGVADVTALVRLAVREGLIDKQPARAGPHDEAA